MADSSYRCYLHPLAECPIFDQLFLLLVNWTQLKVEACCATQVLVKGSCNLELEEEYLSAARTLDPRTGQTSLKRRDWMGLGGKLLIFSGLKLSTQ